ncbi:MAG: TIGR01212 family radical SAM protein [Candidatus Omnitrophica bacterium]|nr:TIGR01212 family radical SAM protein [Candidatus Omnitrophota bacterium]
MVIKNIKPYYSFNQFLRDKFGCRVHRLSLNAGFGCPNLEGDLSSEGCIFCNNRAFSFFAGKTPSLEEQVRSSMDYAKKRFGAKKFIAYFQSFTNTFAPADILKDRYSIIRKFPDVVGLSISTRPDCVDEEKLDMIEEFSRDYMVWVEYGLQTAHNQGLTFLNRSHTYEDFLKAVEMTKSRGIFIGAHLIFGIPSESKEDILATAQAIAGLPLSGIKFHCLHVVKQTKLEEFFERGEVNLLSLEEYADILTDFLTFIPKDWVVLRLVSDADAKYLIAPSWINQKQKALQYIEDEFKKKGIYQGMRLEVNRKP